VILKAKNNAQIMVVNESVGEMLKRTGLFFETKTVTQGNDDEKAKWLPSEREEVSERNDEDVYTRYHGSRNQDESNSERKATLALMLKKKGRPKKTSRSCEVIKAQGKP
jgi:hypothetical protein